jgi:hypothetical protein
VRVLWNDFGSHLRETGFAVEADPHRILPADIDRDGDLDLITGNFMYDSSLDDSVSILENRGAGEFADPRTLDAHKGSPLLAAGDLDGDGDLDLVTAGYGSRQLVVLENGLTGFARRTERPDLPGFPTRYLISKDLDGDGTDEILITGYTPGLLLLSKQPGDAVPSVREKIELVPWGESHVLPLDIDGDGAVDLIAPGSGCPDLQVLLGDRSGRFAAQPPLHAGLQVSVVEAADWNGDGDLDLAGDASPSGIALLLRTPATRSTDCNRNGVPDECDRDCNQNGTPDDCDLASGASRDCDGNSIPDECDQDCDANGMADVCDIRSGKVSDCDGNGVPDSCEIVGRDRDGNGLLDDCEIASGASADCNRNGIPDPVDLRPSFSLTYEEGTVGGSPTTILLEDLDGDGVQEVMTGALSGAVSVLKCLPDGSLAGRRVGSTGAVLLDLRALDADADGDLDVAAAVYDSDCGLSRGWVAILRNDGDLRFAKGPAYPFERSLSCLAVGHFDRDGVEDIVASSTQAPFHPDGICWWLRGKAQGGFELPAQVAEWGGALAVGDVEGDGDDDLALQATAGWQRPEG